MSHALTFEELQQRVTQLPAQQQLQLLAQVSKQLSRLPLGALTQKANAENQSKQQKVAEIDAWLAQCDSVADLWQGTFDAAADVRRIREEE